MSYSLSVICLMLLTAVSVCDSARILAFFPTPSISHQVVFRPVMLELAKRGHEVVVITTDPMFEKGKSPANYTEIDVHDISYELWKEFVEESSSQSTSLGKQMTVAMKQLLTIFEKQVLTTEVQKLIRDKQKYDLLFVEACVRPALAFSHIFKIPTIQFSSFGALPGMYESVGVPNHFYLYPLPLRQKVVNLTIWEKISEFYSNYNVESYFTDGEDSEHAELQRIFGPDIPSIADLRKNIDMIFLNVYPAWDFNRPVPPNVIYLGGLHQNPPKELPKELKSYLDSSSNGVIYMSFGTNVKPSSLSREKVNIFLKAFSTLPYNILWKWDADELEGRPNNVKISKWFPQSDLLRHPNIKLFITQGGLQSTDEALTAGVPLLGIPMLGDQWYNTEMYLHHRIGLKLDMETLNEIDLRKSIDTIVKDQSYRANIIKLRTLMRDQPQTSLERAVWWTEYVLRHGSARHLRSPAANISWAEYLQLELVFVLLAAFILSSIAVGISIKFLINSLRSSSNAKVKTN